MPYSPKLRHEGPTTIFIAPFDGLTDYPTSLSMSFLIFITSTCQSVACSSFAEVSSFCTFPPLIDLPLLLLFRKLLDTGGFPIHGISGL